MNLLEIYLKEIHEEKPYNSEWCRKFPDREFVEVTATWECYGKVYKRRLSLARKNRSNLTKRKARFSRIRPKSGFGTNQAKQNLKH